MPDPSPVARNIRRMRLERKLTRPYVADELGIYLRTLDKWERGESEPNYQYLTRLAEFYETTVPALFEPSES